MKKNNFLAVFDKLSKDEIRKFEIHLNANYQNSKIPLQIFHYYLKFSTKKKTYPELKIVYEKLFGPPPKNKRPLAKLQNGLSDLNLILKDFLIQMKILETDFEQEFLWLKILEQKELFHERDLHLKKIVQQQKENNNIWKSLHLLQLNQFEFFKNDFNKNNLEISQLQDGLHLMDDFFISMQLKYAVESINRKNILNVPLPKMPFLKTILNQLKKNKNAFLLQNQLYYNIYLFLKNENFKHFTQLKDFVFTHQFSLHREERLSALIYMINYLAALLRTGKLKWANETFELYQWGLSHDNIMVQNGIIESLHFRNIVNVAARLKKFSWSKKFVETYHKFLEPSSKEEIIAIAYAMIYFTEEDFQKVLENFDQVKFEEPIFEIQARIYMLACYYEIGRTDNLIMQCETFARFVKRSKKVNDSNKIAATNFTRILKQLQRKKLFKKEIKENIENENALFFKSWLLEKLLQYQRI